ncbi:MAG: hypothetical protein ACOH2F_07235 [Cellulomonas sp.]
MDSYRIALGVGLLRPGVVPDDVLPAAAGAARATTTVESFDVAIVRGHARINVRYLAQGNDDAGVIASRVHAAVSELAAVAGPDLARRDGPRWHRVHWTP